jgi:hypothetical protein
MDSSDKIIAAFTAHLGSRDAALEYLYSLMNGAPQRADLPRVHLKVEYSVAKFDGDITPGKEPVEVLHFKD